MRCFVQSLVDLGILPGKQAMVREQIEVRSTRDIYIGITSRDLLAHPP